MKSLTASIKKLTLSLCLGLSFFTAINQDRFTNEATISHEPVVLSISHEPVVVSTSHEPVVLGISHEPVVLSISHEPVV